MPHKSMFPWVERIHLLRAELLDWLRLMAESAVGWACEDDQWEDPDGEEAAAAAACRAIFPQLYAAVAPLGSDPDESVRLAAVGALCPLLAAPQLADRKAYEAERLECLAADLTMPERASIALTLGEWGFAPRTLLADPHPAVRVCAALAPALEGDPAALGEILAALQTPSAADEWFAEPLPQLSHRATGWFRHVVLDAALERVADFDELLPAAVAVARMTNKAMAYYDWGELVNKAFPVPYSSEVGLSRAQREYLTALVHNDDFWREPPPGFVYAPPKCLADAGLPETQDSMRALLGLPPGGTAISSRR